MSGIINQIIRVVIGRMTNIGINKGIDYMSKRNTGGKETPETRKQAAATRQNVGRTRKMMRILRRIGR